VTKTGVDNSSKKNPNISDHYLKDENMTDGSMTANPYLVQQVKTATPEKLILMLYELGMKSCQTQDNQKAVKVLTELIAALNFEHGEIAGSMFELYRYAMDEVQKKNFDNAYVVFEGMHDIWENVVMKQHTEFA
jgi:flagellin-specific chaperone FliS